jgi:LDH2 family malate/lactate/ureidoglycolate dehydrogenase
MGCVAGALPPTPAGPEIIPIIAWPWASPVQRASIAAHRWGTDRSWPGKIEKAVDVDRDRGALTACGTIAPLMDAPAAAPARFAAAELRRFATALLQAGGLTPDRAGEVAEVLLEGDLLGHTTHGLALLPAYLKSLTESTMERTGDPATLADHGAALTWDGRYLPGPWLVNRAIRVARERLAQQPLVTVVIQRSHHIGCLQAYLKPVTDAGLMMLLSCSDPGSRTVTPHGGVAPRFSPDPIAIGIPTSGDPILVDISTSTTSNGFCQRVAAVGGRLPGPWVVDGAGNATDDPGVLFNGGGGSVLPLGGVDLGHKGFALALFVEALTNALGGHGRAEDVKRWGCSVFVQLIDPERFAGRAAFVRETSFLAQSCLEAPVPAGNPPVRMPGQGALARRQRQLAGGVELHPTILPALLPWADKLGVAPL